MIVNGDILYWKVSPMIENAGNTATKDLHYYLGRFDIVPVVGLVMNGIDPDKSDVEFSSLPNAVALGPHSKMLGTTILITKDEAAQMRDQKLTVTILGQAAYRDIYDRSHETIFCYRILGETGVSGDIGLYGTKASVPQVNAELSYRMCGRNNCTDKECGPKKNFGTALHPSISARSRRWQEYVGLSRSAVKESSP
jgi:hypothetical protein